MATLKATYSSESEIPDALLEYYKEQGDGTFKINLQNGTKTQADIDRVKKSLDKERGENEELKKKLSKYPDDFDPDKWDKVKDIDPDNPPTGGGEIDKDSAEFQQAVSQAVREKEKEIKQDFKDREKELEQDFNSKKESLNQTYKENWIKQELAEKFGFTDPKRLRWLILDIKAGQHPDIKKKIESIDVVEEDGKHKIVGGDLKDPQGAVEVLENIAQSDVSKDYKPAKENSGGGAGNDDKETTEMKGNPFKANTEHYNVSKQSELMREKPEQAKKLAREAGWPEDKVEQIGK